MIYLHISGDDFEAAEDIPGSEKGFQTPVAGHRITRGKMFNMLLIVYAHPPEINSVASVVDPVKQHFKITPGDSKHVIELYNI